MEGWGKYVQPSSNTSKKNRILEVYFQEKLSKLYVKINM